MKKSVVIVAGGKGLRMGGEVPKQFLPIGGKPVLMRTVEQFKKYDPSMIVVLVLPKTQKAYWDDLCRKYAFPVSFLWAEGGDTRFASVKNGLNRLCEEIGEETVLVGVHDGVRPFVSLDTIRRCYETAAQKGGAVPVLPLVDSVREETPDGRSRAVDRSRYRAVQTPQVFRSDIFKKAYAQPYSSLFTDDASVVESGGFPLTLVEGNRENIKLTTPFDLRVAEALLNE